MTKNTVDYVIGCYDDLALNLRKEADNLREYDDRIPSANALDKAAAEIEKTGAALHEQLDLVSAEVYAEINRITVQTVRRWCRNDEITHFQDQRGLLIPRHAKRNRESRLD